MFRSHDSSLCNIIAAFKAVEIEYEENEEIEREEEELEYNGPEDWLNAGLDDANHQFYNTESVKPINNLKSYSINHCAIQPVPSQFIIVRFGGTKFKICLDSGATISFITIDLAKNLQLEILPNNQLARLADNMTRMTSLGEIDATVIEAHTGRIYFKTMGFSIT